MNNREVEPGDPPDVVITGCSRSGTKFMSQLLTNLGVVCGHERVFKIHPIAWGYSLEALFARHPDAEGDASFLAAPFVDELPDKCVVLHQIRDPIEVIRSHMGIGFFADPYVPSMYLAENHPDFVAVVRRFSPEIFLEPDELARCMRYWVSWNQLVQRAELNPRRKYLRYRVEALDAVLLKRVMRFFDMEVEDRELRRALQSVSTKTNSRVREESVSWERIPWSHTKSDLSRLAAQYGYPTLGGPIEQPR